MGYLLSKYATHRLTVEFVNPLITSPFDIVYLDCLYSKISLTFVSFSLSAGV